ncbi:MAG: aspartate kinase [Spirochaetaceae bacterium]|nr:aspartate kinase [Spirochaetaceae bacterium]
MIVMKFGGSSMAGPDRIREAARIIKMYAAQKPVVVLSAMGDTTDYLLEAAEKALTGTVDLGAVRKLHRGAIAALGIDVPGLDSLMTEMETLLTGMSLLRELSKRSRDYLVSFGERLSVRIMAAYLNTHVLPARAVDAWDGGFRSDSDFTKAELLDSVWQDIPKAFEPYTSGRDNAIPMVTGFIAKDDTGRITTLGRGGSDLTATMLGAALKADEVQTWKDVDGILTADPRIVPNARLVPEVTYDEAAELAYFGAQVLHPRSMNPCRKTGTLVRVKNSSNPQAAGSVIREKHSGPVPPVRAITSVKHVKLIDIVSTRMLGASGFLAHIFNQFLKWNISIDMVATSEVSVSLTVNTPEDLTGLLEDLRKVAAVECHSDKAIVTIICDAAHSGSILAAAFAALKKQNINVQMISQGASKVNVSMICDDSEADTAVRTLHEALFDTLLAAGLLIKGSVCT